MTKGQALIKSEAQTTEPSAQELTFPGVDQCNFSNLFSILLFVLIFSLPGRAEPLACTKLLKPKTPAEFIIPLPSSDILSTEIREGHAKLIANDRIMTMKNILANIALDREPPSGPLHAQTETSRFIMEFRQDTSLLRTLFQSLKKRNSAQKEFIKFVRDFGVLKDLVMMNDTEGARAMANTLLKTYSNLNFDTLISKYRISSKEELRVYFEGLIEKTRNVMRKVLRDQDETYAIYVTSSVTVDEVHEVRKSLRDILRFMELQESSIVEWNPDSPETERIALSNQISYLKKINTSLGKICDQNAEKILAGELTKESMILFPQKLIVPINYFLKTYRFP